MSLRKRRRRLGDTAYTDPKSLIVVAASIDVRIVLYIRLKTS